MNDKPSILFTGFSSLLFTDDDNVSYIVHTERTRVHEYDMILFSREIEPIGVDKKLSDREREIILSKILSLTKNIKWLIK